MRITRAANQQEQMKRNVFIEILIKQKAMRELSAARAIEGRITWRETQAISNKDVSRHEYYYEHCMACTPHNSWPTLKIDSILFEQFT